MFLNFSHVIYTAIFGAVPLLLVWAFFGKYLTRDLGLILKITLVVLILLPIGDGYAIRNGVWGFNDDKILGIWILGAPLDDYIMAAIITPLCASLALSGYYIQRSFERGTLNG